MIKQSSSPAQEPTVYYQKLKGCVLSPILLSMFTTESLIGTILKLLKFADDSMLGCSTGAIRTTWSLAHLQKTPLKHSPLIIVLDYNVLKGSILVSIISPDVRCPPHIKTLFKRRASNECASCGKSLCSVAGLQNKTGENFTLI